MTVHDSATLAGSVGEALTRSFVVFFVADFMPQCQTRPRPPPRPSSSMSSARTTDEDEDELNRLSLFLGCGRSPRYLLNRRARLVGQCRQARLQTFHFHAQPLASL